MLIDTVFINQLRIETIIGVHAWEQHAPRPLLLDIELGMDSRAAAASDLIGDAVDYKAVADAINELTAARQFKLLETLAEAAAQRLFERFPIQTLRLAIGKPGAVPEALTVGVRIERRREDYAVCGR